MANQRGTFSKRNREMKLKDRAKEKLERRGVRNNAPGSSTKGPAIAWDQPGGVNSLADDEEIAPAADADAEAAAGQAKPGAPAAPAKPGATAQPAAKPGATAQPAAPGTPTGPTPAPPGTPAQNPPPRRR